MSLDDAQPALLDPFGSEHPAGYLADSQFDYPGHDSGWRYYALDAENAFATLAPPADAGGSATPLAFLVCEDDPHLRIGRDVVHAGYRRRPCLQWHAPSAGTYRLEGEVGLLRCDAVGQLEVRVFVDDVEVLVAAIDYPHMLTFVIEAGLEAGGFVRVLFGCKGHIDANDALHYLRIRAGDAALPAGACRVESRCEEPEGWQRLRAILAPRLASNQTAAGSAMLAHRLYAGAVLTDPALLAMVQQRAEQHTAQHAAGHRKPRFFRVHPVASSGGVGS